MMMWVGGISVGLLFKGVFFCEGRLRLEPAGYGVGYGLEDARDQTEDLAGQMAQIPEICHQLQLDEDGLLFDVVERRVEVH